MVKQRARRGDTPLPADAHILRGGRLNDEQALRDDARFNHDIYGFYGISVWSPTVEMPEDTLLRTKLSRFAEVTRFDAGDLYDRRLELWDTGQSPHYDVVYVTATDLDALVAGLLTARCTIVTNVHYDPEGG